MIVLNMTANINQTLIAIIVCFALLIMGKGETPCEKGRVYE
jgi:hypothetical protein